MSTKQPRHTPSPAPSLPTNHSTSKFPKFLQKQSNRDGPRSVTEPAGNLTTLASRTSAAPTSPEFPQSSIPIAKTRKASKFLGIKDKDREKDRKPSSATPFSPPTDVGEAPVIVEPPSIPRPRTRSERPLASTPDSHHSSSQLFSSTSSTSRIGDFPTKLSGWFSHTFSTSSTDIPSLLAYHSTASPKSKAPSALLTAAKHGKGHLDKAMRYLLDSDATPDKCTDPIWLLGVQHPGYETPLPALPDVVAISPANNSNSGVGSSFGLAFRRNSGSPSSFRSSTSSIASSELSQSTNSSSSKIPNPAANWPPVFYIDFTSRIWLTYRSQFPVPIKDGRLADLSDSAASGCEGNNELGDDVSPSILKSRPWNWVGVGGGGKTWTSDSGWGCMLRTGQSLLANALIHMHLGRDWRRPPYPVHTADYATYVQILTWFLDTPVQEAPFSVHRMALAGKELGTDVGQWFGPSVAAGAIKTLVNSFLECGLAVAVAIDGTLYQTHVFAASHGDHSSRKRHNGNSTTAWGDRPVLLLLGIRLGIDGVNPIYYDTIKLLYTFPQSVGIAGGRPSSSYYFVGSQADNLFYLDPHNVRPTIPLRPPPVDVGANADTCERREMGAISDSEREQDSALPRQQSQKRPQQRRPSFANNSQRIPASPSSTRTASSTFSHHVPISPSPLQQQFSNDSMRSGLDPIQLHYCTAYSAAELKTFHCERVKKMPMSGLDPSMLIGFLCRDEKDWWDFKKRVADLPRTIFSVQNEMPTWPSDSDDSVGLESISEPDDMDLDDEVNNDDAAVGVVDDNEAEEEEEEEGEVVEFDDEGAAGEEEVDSEIFFDTLSGSASTSNTSSPRHRHKRLKSEDADTEEDPVGPVTPGPNSRFDIVVSSVRKGGREEKDADEYRGFEDDEDDSGDDIEDDWIDPSLPSPPSTSRPGTRPLPKPLQQPQLLPPPVPMKFHGSPSVSSSSSSSPPVLASKSKSSSSKQSSSTSNHSVKAKIEKSKKQIPVPVPQVRLLAQQQQPQEQHYPFPVAPVDGPRVSSPQHRVASSQDRRNGGGASNGQENQRNSAEIATTEKRMHNARARDGGRTQSGGVKGILPEG